MFVWAIFYLYPSSVRFRRWPQTINQPGPPLYFAHPELHDLLDRCSSHLRRVKRNETGSKDWYKCEYDLVLFVFKLLLIWILTSCIYIFKIAKILHTICIDLNRHVLETQNIVGILIHQLYHVHISIFFLWCIYIRYELPMLWWNPDRLHRKKVSSFFCRLGHVILVWGPNPVNLMWLG